MMVILAIIHSDEELVYECQSCFTTFKASNQSLWERETHRCPSCWYTDYKVVYPKLQDRINAVLET